MEIQHPLLGVDTSFVQTVQDTGGYTLDATNVILSVITENPDSVGTDTLGFTADTDSLHLVVAVPLGGFESLIAGLLPDAGVPLAILGLKRVADSGTPLEITADFNENGSVDFGDFVLFVMHYGTKKEDDGFEQVYDLNGNEVVDFLDFVLFAKQYGQPA